MPPLPIFYLAVDNESDKEKKESVKKPRKLPKTQAKPKESKEENADGCNVTMIVGVDFGTTYSGFATALLTSSSGDVRLHKSWPGCSGYQDKAPSMLTYSFNKSGTPKVKAWGYKATPSENTFTWFKLGLAQDQKQNEHDDDLLHEGTGQIKCPTGMEFTDLVTDYLREFHEHFLETLKKESKSDTFSMLAFRFVLAVPAGWPDEHRQLIRSCAIDAGFGSRKQDEVFMIDEPEAAALAALYSYGSKFEALNTLKVDTNVMVVDMGGGTVDLITYTIKNLKPLQVEEACVGSSAKCGSSTIDRHFRKWMEGRFGDEFTTRPAKEIGPKSRFMVDFEDLKRRFDQSTDSESIHLKMNWDNEQQYEADDGEVILQREDIEGMFSPVVENVIGLIQGQVQRTRHENDLPITAIILCGGLAESEHIRMQLKQFCAKTLPDIELLVPENPWSAICRGAAMSKVKSNNFVKSRKARRSYGTVTYVPFIEGEHDEGAAFMHPKLGKMAQKMFWHIKRNERLLTKNMYHWLKNVSIHIGGDVGYRGRIEVFASDTVDAPLWRTDRSVQKLGDLTVDLSTGRPSTSKKRKYSSSSWIPTEISRTTTQKIEIGQAILPKTGSVEFIARVGKKNVGTATFEYAPRDHDDESGEGGDDGDDRDFWLHRPFMENPPTIHHADEDDDDDSDEDSGDDD